MMNHDPEVPHATCRKQLASKHICVIIIPAQYKVITLIMAMGLCIYLQGSLKEWNRS